MSDKVFKVYWWGNTVDLNVATVTARSAKQLKLDERYAAWGYRKVINPDDAYATEEDAWLGAIGDVTKHIVAAEHQARTYSDARSQMNIRLKQSRESASQPNQDENDDDNHR